VIRRVVTDVLAGIGLTLFFVGFYRLAGANWSMLIGGATLCAGAVLERIRD